MLVDIGGSNRGVAVSLNPVSILTLRASSVESRMVGRELGGKIEVNGSVQSAAQNPDRCLSPVSSRRIQEPVSTPSSSTPVPTFQSKHAENEVANGHKGSDVLKNSPNQGCYFHSAEPCKSAGKPGSGGTIHLVYPPDLTFVTRCGLKRAYIPKEDANEANVGRGSV